MVKAIYSFVRMFFRSLVGSFLSIHSLVRSIAHSFIYSFIYFRYGILLEDNHGLDDEERTARILEYLRLDGYELGKTKVHEVFGFSQTEYMCQMVPSLGCHLLPQ